MPDYTPEETEAGSAYGAEATFFHAIQQGRSEELIYCPGFKEFELKAAGRVKALDSAIAKSPLPEVKTVYSGHGIGFFIRGSLSGDPTKFIGLRYQYPGYISTTVAKEVALDSFLDKRGFAGSSPTLLEFRLPAGFLALDMNHVGHQGELEFLLPRKHPFEIVEAGEVGSHRGNTVLQLTLKPL